jgi:hypothetical protein
VGRQLDIRGAKPAAHIHGGVIVYVNMVSNKKSELVTKGWGCELESQR